ncbi:hypothetical protein [Candidatus Protochlamydia amoebophila]|nr:hypothetical protein [Candidatus Protochlamydia amoebophila]
MMKFKLKYSAEAKDQFLALESSKDKNSQYKAVAKTLGLMQINLRHPSLNTHKFGAIFSPFDGEVFESYAQNKTPGAYRVFWCYGPSRGYLYIIAITPHP